MAASNNKVYYGGYSLKRWVELILKGEAYCLPITGIGCFRFMRM